MGGLQIATFTGGATEVEEAALQAFKDTLRGEMIRSGDEAYAQARRIWNGMIDKRPRAIVRSMTITTAGWLGSSSPRPSRPRASGWLGSG